MYNVVKKEVKVCLTQKSELSLWSQNAKVAQLVEHNLAKVRVAGSSPVFRSIRPDGGMVDTKDLKSFDHCGCAGSSPAPGTGRQSAYVDCRFVFVGEV